MAKRKRRGKKLIRSHFHWEMIQKKGTNMVSKLWKNGSHKMTFLMLLLKINMAISLLACFGCHPEARIPADIIKRIENAENKYKPTPLHEIFTEHQLLWIGTNTEHMERYISKKINDGSVLAIQLADIDRMDTTLPALRKRLLTLQGIIGSDAAKYVNLVEGESWLSDKFFPHHLLCIKVIEGISNKPLAEVVSLNFLERHYLETLASMARLPNSIEEIDADYIDNRTWCAKWLLTKLSVSENAK